VRGRPWRGRPGPDPDRAPGPVLPAGGPDDPDAWMAFLGAIRFEMVRTPAAYMLFEDRERQRPFYVGHSVNPARRLGEWLDKHGDRMADVWVIPCATEHEARVTQLMLIVKFEARLINVLGTTGYERQRAAAEHAAKYYDAPGHVRATMRKPEEAMS